MDSKDMNAVNKKRRAGSATNVNNATKNTSDHYHYLGIKEIIEHMVENKLKAQTLEEIAALLGMSGGHLQKIFTEWVGITPKQFSRYLSLEYSKELLRQNKSTMQTSLRSGLSGSGRLHDLFVNIEAMTPGEYQNQGKGLTIWYSLFETKFGLCLAASTSKGICNVLFSDTAEDALADLRSRWPRAVLVQKILPAHRQLDKYFQQLFSSRIIPGLSRSPSCPKIKLHLRGTNFQIKVWEALLSIPEGSLSTYGGIAQQLGGGGGSGDSGGNGQGKNKSKGNLSRAVGVAIGDNPVGYIIPCHRVLKSTGEISGYHWGVERKRAMLLYEASRREIYEKAHKEARKKGKKAKKLEKNKKSY